MLRLYYTTPNRCQSIWAWIHSSWHLNAIERGYQRLGTYREIGSRWLGVEFIWFANDEARSSYEQTR